MEMQVEIENYLKLNDINGFGRVGVWA